jgi:hypothetical protein
MKMKMVGEKSDGGMILIFCEIIPYEYTSL